MMPTSPSSEVDGVFKYVMIGTLLIVSKANVLIVSRVEALLYTQSASCQIGS